MTPRPGITPPPDHGEAVLPEPDARQRAGLLSDLQRALADEGICSVLARKHRLVLRYNQPLGQPSGPVNPELHIFTPAGSRVATTNGTIYSLPGMTCPATNPQAAAKAIVKGQAMTTTRPNPTPQPLTGHSIDTDPRWEITTSGTGVLTAILTGSDAPITVTAPDLATLREHIKATILRGLL